MYRDAESHVESLPYDEWDPPIMVVTTASVPEREYVNQLHELRNWARSDPDSDYDEEMIHLSLLPRLARNASR